MGEFTPSPKRRRGLRIGRPQHLPKRRSGKDVPRKIGNSKTSQLSYVLCKQQTLAPRQPKSNYHVKKFTKNVQLRREGKACVVDLSELQHRIESFKELRTRDISTLTNAEKKMLSTLSMECLVLEEQKLHGKIKIIRRQICNIKTPVSVTSPLAPQPPMPSEPLSSIAGSLPAIPEDGTPEPPELGSSQIRERARGIPVEKTAGHRRTRTSRSKSKVASQSKTKAHVPAYTGLHWSSLYFYRLQLSGTDSRIDLDLISHSNHHIGWYRVCHHNARLALHHYNASKSHLRLPYVFEEYKVGRLSKEQALDYEGLNPMDRFKLVNLMHELANKTAVEPQTKKRRVSSQSDEFTGVTSSTSDQLDSLPGMYVLTDVLFILEVYTLLII